jgi:ribosomal protein S18 acetylase RimI-like enzyme
MKIIYRAAKKEDSLRIAELDNIASDGAIEFLFHDLAANMTPVQIVASNLESDSYPHSYRRVIVAEYAETIIGMSLSFPGKYHKITDEMKNFFPHARINHFKHFFSAPVGDSYFLDALCVDENFRNKGIGSKLIELTKNKARIEGYNSLCLLVFKDNANAQNVYRKNGFEVIGWIELPSHKLMPHEGGCVLMKATF